LAMAPDAATQMERRTHREDQTNAATMLALLSYRRLISSHRKKQERLTNVSILISSETMQMCLLWKRPVPGLNGPSPSGLNY